MEPDPYGRNGYGSGWNPTPTKMEMTRNNKAGLVRRSLHGGGGGFTLIEILVTIGLIILLLMLVGYPILAGLAFMEKGIARADALSAARLAMDAMTRELAEAMYVFDPPVDGRFIAFLAPVSPPQGAAPIEPQAAGVRYWAALRDPALAYWPFYSYAPGAPGKPINPYYLARTEIPDPGERRELTDPWNDSGEALTRATFWYSNGHEYPLGETPPVTWPTAQPGYPWLEAVTLYASQAERERWYVERAVGLTPDNVDYDVPTASFSPEPITNEALVPWTTAFPRDYSRYRARYPLWVNFAQWHPPDGAFATMGQISVYSGSPRILAYQTAVEASTGDVWVEDAVGTRLYNTAAYPARDVTDDGQAEFAFGLDYDRGEVRFDFPAEDAIAASASMYIYDLTDAALPPAPPKLSYVPNPQIVRGSTTVWVESLTGEVTYYTQVDPPPTLLGNNTIGKHRFAIKGLQIIFDDDLAGPWRPGDGDTIHVRYRYRNNREDQLVVATYATKAIINISLTVSKRDIAARTPQASRQDATLVAKVKLKNVPR